MTYEQAIAHLNALVPELAAPTAAHEPQRRFDLADMRRLCEALGNPQTATPAVLIAGTNGKGSTAATLASILCAAGYRAGLYTSPHLNRVNERIQLGHPTFPSEYGSSAGNGAHAGADGPIELTQIPDADFARLYTHVDEVGRRLTTSGELPAAPSFFERLTAVAFLYYAEQGAEIVVLEVGLGGRLDATNVVEPLLSVVTDISLDHQEYLGNTLAAIAGEKCGILRENGVLVTLPQHPEVNQAIGDVAMRLNVRGINAADYLPNRVANRDAEPSALFTIPAQGREETQYHPHQGRPSDQGSAGPKPVVSVAGERYLVSLGQGGPVQVESPLAGEHQRRNLALAIASAIALREKGFVVMDKAILSGISTTRWPGRLETLPPNLLLDVAHNPAGAWTLRSALATLPEAQPRTLIFSCLRDKDLHEMTRILFPLFDSAGGDPLRRQDHVILAPIESPRAAAVQDLLQAAHAMGVPAHAAPHLLAALRQARQITPPGGLIIATGSVYLVGEIRELAFTEGLSH